MLTRACLVLIVACFTLTMSYAQEATPEPAPPWPPDPTDLFAPGIEVIASTEILFCAENGPPRNTWFDNTARLIAVCAGGAKQFIPYPTDVASITAWTLYHDNTRVFISQSPAPRAQPTAWQITDGSDVLVPFNLACNNDGRYFWHTFLEASWVFVQENDQLFLCETQTGQMIPLPSNLEVSQHSYQEQPPVVQISPDGEWLAFVALAPQWEFPSSLSPTLFSVHLETQRINQLGVIENINSYISLVWIHNDLILATADGIPEFSSCTQSIAFSDQPNSLREALSGYRFCPEFDEEAMTLSTFVNGWNRGDFGDGSNNAAPDYSCYTTIYDLEAGETIIRNYGELCFPEYISERGRGYHRDTRDVREAVVVGFNVETGEMAGLYRGEVEYLHWVSPQEDYALMVLDDNGFVGSIPYYDPQLWSFDNPRLTLIHLTTGEIIYETLHHVAMGSFFNMVAVHHLPPNLFILVRRVNDHPDRDPNITEIIQLEGTETRVTQFEGTLLNLIEQEQQLIITSRAENLQTITLYDIALDSQVQLLSIPSAYSITNVEVQNDTLTLEMQPTAWAIDEAVYRVRYTARLPSFD